VNLRKILEKEKTLKLNFCILVKISKKLSIGILFLLEYFPADESICTSIEICTYQRYCVLAGLLKQQVLG